MSDKRTEMKSADRPGKPRSPSPAALLFRAGLFISVGGILLVLGGCTWINGPDLAPPAGVSATTEELDKIVLTWEAVENSDIYYIYRSDTEDGEFLYQGFTYSPTYTDTEIGHEVAYWYRLTASDLETNKESGYSDPVKGDSTHEFSWSPAVAADAAAQARIARDKSDGTVYLSGAAGSDGGVITVSSYNSADAAWETLGDPFGSTDTTLPRVISLCADRGTVYCAYSDAGVGNKLTVKKYAGGTWSEIGKDGNSVNARYLSMDIAPDSGTVYIAYIDDAAANTVHVRTASALDIEAVTVNTAGSPTSSLVRTASGGVFTAYEDGAGTPIEAAGTTVTSGTDMRDNYFDFIAVSATEMYAAYYTDTLHVKKYDGSSWTEIPLSGVTASETAGSVALAFDNGNLYLFYREALQGKVMKYAGGQWSVLATADQDGGVGVSPTSLDLEAFQNDVYAAYVSGGTAQMSVWE